VPAYMGMSSGNVIQASLGPFPSGRGRVRPPSLLRSRSGVGTGLATANPIFGAVGGTLGGAVVLYGGFFCVVAFFFRGFLLGFSSCCVGGFWGFVWYGCRL